MSFNIKNYKNELLFLPLGGCNEIGANFNLYHLDGKWLIVDCGSGFADDHLPGVDMIVPDVTFLEKHKKDIVGMVLTHAHEDHLGGVQYLWNELECPIYATNFTASFLRTKISEYDIGKRAQINKLDPRSTLELGPFSIEMIALTHSAPEMQALMIRTPKGNVLHTGDWKFDPDPIVGDPSDLNRLKECGDEGVLALVCDSTNVFSPGHSGSEGKLRDSLTEIIAGCPNMVVVTTFASNLARIESLVHAARETVRKVVASGRSVKRIVDVAHNCGYLEDLEHLIDEQDVSRYKRNELLIIATGCQGEPMAATSKMATGSHQSIKLAPEDTVIFSSKIIPGNDKKIFRMFNQLVQQRVEVITERDHFVHVSGHPYVDELKQMYDLVRPQLCIPVHGEPVHIHEHARLAREHGVPSTLEIQNGQVAKLTKEQSELVGSVDSGYFAVEGSSLLPIESNIFKIRRRMRDDGIGIIAVVLGKNKLTATPMVTFPGCLDKDEDGELLLHITETLEMELNRYISRNKKSSKDQIETQIRSIVRKIIKSEIGKSPALNIMIEFSK